MQDLAKDKIEDGKGVDDIECDCALVPDEGLQGVTMGVSSKVGQIVVHDPAEDDVNHSTDEPTKKDLVVCMNSMVNPAECNQEACEECH